MWHLGELHGTQGIHANETELGQTALTKAVLYQVQFFKWPRGLQASTLHLHPNMSLCIEWALCWTSATQTKSWLWLSTGKSHNKQQFRVYIYEYSFLREKGHHLNRSLSALDGWVTLSGPQWQIGLNFSARRPFKKTQTYYKPGILYSVDQVLWFDKQTDVVLLHGNL